MRNVLGTEVIEKNRNTFYVSAFIWKSCRLWDNLEKYVRARRATDDNIIRRMRIACWISNGTEAHSKNAIIIVFTLQDWL